MACSAGGLAALTQLLSALDAAFPLPVLVVQHMDPSRISMLPAILARRVPMDVRQAADGDHLQPGTVYVAPPDFHLLAGRHGNVTLSHSDRVRFVRPSADRLFTSLADSYGSRGVAVVLTGTGRDGAEGICAVKRAGGTVLAQDEATSQFFGMPGAAIATGCVDFVVPLKDIAPTLNAMTRNTA